MVNLIFIMLMSTTINCMSASDLQNLMVGRKQEIKNLTTEKNDLALRLMNLKDKASMDAMANTIVDLNSRIEKLKKNIKEAIDNGKETDQKKSELKKEVDTW